MNAKKILALIYFVLMFFMVQNNLDAMLIDKLNELRDGLNTLKLKLTSLNQALTKMKFSLNVEKVGLSVLVSDDSVKDIKVDYKLKPEIDKEQESFWAYIISWFNPFAYSKNSKKSKVSSKSSTHDSSSLGIFNEIDEELSSLVSGLIAQMKPHNKKDLKYYAEIDGYGYKAGNLKELETLCNKLKVLSRFIAHSTKSKELKIRVPEFVGISSISVKNFLKKNGFDISKSWNELISKFNKSDFDDFIKNKNFSASFLAELKKIENGVKKVFDDFSLHVNEKFDFDANFGQGINKKLGDIKNFKSSLTVRSTGKEDTDEISNAGGNETVPNVAPQDAEILRAMGVVVASYFSQKSFTQRLLGNDDTLFKDEPFAPVLIQRMIGERIRGIRSKNIEKVLNSGVGSLSQKWQTFKKNNDYKKSLDTFFNTYESDLDWMIEQAKNNKWKIKVSLTNDGSVEKKVDPDADLVVLAIEEILKGIGGYCAVIIEPVSDDKIIERPVPACGVMFTEEVGGSISKNYLAKEDWNYSKKAPSTGVVQIDMSYGHNEGVVNGLVGVDTYYIPTFDKIYSIVRPKPFRKFPSLKENTKLEDKDNPKSLGVGQVLSLYEGVMLKVLASALEEYYRKPMDVEFVIDRQSSIIYLVQARPITHNKNQGNPSYISDYSELKGDHLVGETIISADSAVRLLDGNQIIVKNTICEAFESYMHSKDKENIQAIFIGQHAPPTSHEGTQFRASVKPVIFIKNINILNDKINSHEIKFLIDPQQCLVIADEIKKDLKTLKNENIVRDGWKNYPIAPMLSSSMVDNFDISKTEESLEALRERLSSGINREDVEALIKKFKKEDSAKELIEPKLGILIESVAQADNEKDVKLNLSALLNIVTKYMDVYFLKIKPDDNLKQYRALFINSLVRVCNNILDTCSIKKNDENFIKRLLPVRFLQALIFEQPDPDQALDAFSLANFVFRTLKQEATAIKLLDQKGSSKKSDEIVQYLKIANASLSDDIGNKWVDFVLKLDGGLKNENEKLFNQFIKKLSSLGLIGIWLHTDFLKNESKPNALKELIALYKKDESLLNEIDKKFSYIKILNPNLFGQITIFDKQWDLLKKFVGELIDSTFIEKFKKAEDLGKISVLRLLEVLVDTFDKSIKAVTASNQYSVFLDKSVNLKDRKNKLFTFLEMLQLYVQLLKGVSEYFENKDTLDKYIDNKIITAINLLKSYASDNDYLVDKLNLVPSNGFDVSNVVVGCVGTDVIVEGNTFEDIFTFIHQSLINVLSFLLGETSIKNLENENLSCLPDLVKEMLTQIHSIKKFDTSAEFGYLFTKENLASFMGISFGNGKVIYKYNYPLRSHSAFLFLEYHKKTNTVRLGCTACGKNEWGRFYKIGDYAKAIAWALNLSDAEVTTKNMSVTFWWKIEESDLKILSTVIQNPKIPDHLRKNVFALCIRQANDGNAENSDGLTYATDGVDNVIYRENLAYLFIEKNFLATDENKREFAKKVIKESLAQDRPHMYLDRVLEYIPSGNDGDSYWTDVISIFEKLLVDGGQYAVNSDLFFFRGNRSWSNGDTFSYDSSSKNGNADDYYNVSGHNLYETLKNHENHSTVQEIQSDDNRGIKSFVKAVPQILMNKIFKEKLYEHFSSNIKPKFKELLEKHKAVFSYKKINWK